MFINYFKTALRNLLREKSSSFLNLAGLTLGITCSLTLFLLVKHLSSFDNFHQNRDRIYRVVTESDSNNGRFYTAGIPRPLPDAFREDFPEAREVTFTSYRSNALVLIPQATGEARKFQEEAGVVFAEPNFFKVFDRPLYIGDAAKGLDDPNEAIISRSLARKYFGTEEVVGEVVAYDTIEYKITAVMDDHRDNTDFPFTLMLSSVTLKDNDEPNDWRGIWSEEHCYILLKEDAKAADIEARMPAFVEKYLGKENYRNQTFVLQPLADLHFDARYGTYTYNTTPREMLVALGVIALFLILTACINFVNLATAEAVKRSREVGIRKSLGSTRRQLILQFLGETALVTVIAMLLSLGMTEMALSFLNPFLELHLAMNFATDSLLWVFMTGVTLTVSVLSGLYPAMTISGFNPVIALKNQMNNKSSSGYNLRRGLVVIQLTISQFFIMGTIILLSQMNYFQSRELGFRKDAVLVLPIPENENPESEAEHSKMRTLREEVGELAGVANASLGSTPPSAGLVRSSHFYFEGEDETRPIQAQIKAVDGNYLSLYEIDVLGGKGIGDNDTARGLVVNQELLRVAGITNHHDVIGRAIRLQGRTLPVVGVVKDFHTVSLHDPIEPTILMNGMSDYGTLSLRVHPAQVGRIIGEVKAKWERAYPEYIFEYQFLDDQIRAFYEGDQKMSTILTVFTCMAIFIGCLGLFGLATFMANQKTKEIGVRKTLGASVPSIVILFSKEYVKLVAIGFFLASPLVWYLMNKWLETFAYKIGIGPLVFITGLALTLLVAVATVGYKSFAAAIVNPIRSLRYE